MTMQIHCFGQSSRQGTYALFIHLATELNLVFGKFHRRRTIRLNPAMYLYIGSALGNNPRSMPLARRLVRHASRTGSKPPHKAREELIGYCRQHGLAEKTLEAPAEKKRHWHIDYLLDSLHAEIDGITIIRFPSRLETALSDIALASKETFIIAPGLGAQDTGDTTHVYGIRNPDAFRPGFEADIEKVLNRQTATATP